MANALEYLEQPNTTSEATVAVAGEDTVGTLQITDDIDVLLDVLPVRIREALRREPRLTDLIEVVMDLGRLPEARFMEGDVYLSEHEVTQDDLRSVTESIGDLGRTTAPASSARFTAFRPSAIARAK